VIEEKTQPIAIVDPVVAAERQQLALLQKDAEKMMKRRIVMDYFKEVY
jgi:hypothetical protein